MSQGRFTKFNKNDLIASFFQKLNPYWDFKKLGNQFKIYFDENWDQM